MMRNRVVGILSALLALSALLLIFLHLWPYSNERKALDQEIRALSQAHQSQLKNLTAPDVATRISSIEALLQEPDVLKDLETRMKAHCDRATFVRRVFPGKCSSPDWADSIRNDIRRTIVELPRQYSETVKLNINSLRTELSTEPVFEQAMASGRVFTENNQAIQASIVSLSERVAPGIANEFDEITQIKISPFNDNARDLELVLRELGQQLVASSHAGLNSLLVAARSAQTAQSALSQSQNSVIWLRDLRSAAVEAENMGVESKYLRQLFATSEHGTREARHIVSWVQNCLAAQQECQNHLQNALVVADHANQLTQQMGKFDHSDQIAPIVEKWHQADGHASRAVASLQIGAPSSLQPLTRNILDPTRHKVEPIAREIASHSAKVSAEYAEARKQEQTWEGQVYRGAGRAVTSLLAWGSKAVNQASESRIAHELGISARMFVLGTKAFYDMMDPNSDPISWAYKYTDDVEQLMAETDDVMRMEGPSLTGKNTILEDLVNSAYSSSFEK